MNNVRVAVCLVTYNQEKYIEQAINSVLSQQTTFPVDIVVGNDCSIDSTAEVLQRILENTRRVNGGVIVFNRLNNLGIVGNTIDLFRYIIEQDYTYVAMLDGDDWWCDENKLQMQVELMEKNKDVSFCYMRGTSDEKLAKNHRDRDTNHIRIKDMFDEIRHTGIANGTVVHRVSMLRKVPFDKIFGQNLLSLDYPTNVYMARQGKVAFIDHISLFWRRTGNTTSSAASKEKAYRYIDHEVRQGLFLSSEFPNTSYAFSKKEAEEFRCWQMYMWSYSQKDYESIVEAMSHDEFPHTWLASRPESRYLKNKIYFYAYVYFIKKVQTVLKLIKNKL